MKTWYHCAHPATRPSTCEEEVARGLDLADRAPLVIGCDPGIVNSALSIWVGSRHLATVSIKSTPSVTPGRAAIAIMKAIDEILDEIGTRQRLTMAVIEAQGMKWRKYAIEHAALVNDLADWFGSVCDVVLVPPATVKSVIAGNGRATKADIKAAVKSILAGNDAVRGIETYDEHMVDAVALALIGLAMLGCGDVCIQMSDHQRRLMASRVRRTPAVVGELWACGGSVFELFIKPLDNPALS